jgi:hypothetical protein
MSPSVRWGAGADKVPVTLGPHILEGSQMAEQVTLSHRLLQVLRSDDKQNFWNIMIGDEPWSCLETSVTSGGSRSRDYLPHHPNKIFEWKSGSVRSFVLGAVSIVYLPFRQEIITIQHCSPSLLFPIYKKPLLRSTTKDVEMIGN